MPDQFSRTMGNDPVGAIDGLGRRVRPVAGVEGKRIERKQDIANEQRGGQPHHGQHFSDYLRPDPELWAILLEAVQRFNEHQDIRHTPYTIRLWAQNNAFRVQVIHEETGALVKQTQPIQFKDVTAADLDHIINALIGEEGVVIDIMR